MLNSMGGLDWGAYFVIKKVQTPFLPECGCGYNTYIGGPYVVTLCNWKHIVELKLGTWRYRGHFLTPSMFWLLDWLGNCLILLVIANDDD